MAQVSVNITSEDLQKSARKYRKELLACIGAITFFAAHDLTSGNPLCRDCG